MQLPFTRKNKHCERVGLHLGERGVALARLRRVGGRIVLDACEMQPLPPGDDPKRHAGEVLSNADLGKLPVASVVLAGDYQLLLVETPEVPENEITDAVRWRIRDLVAFPVEDAVIDVFEVPEQANRAQRPMLYVVAARPEAVRQQVDLLADAGVALDALDIPELCLRNVAACLQQDQYGVAFLSFEEDHGSLMLTRGGVLYLIRRLETGLRAIREALNDEFARSELASGIALEVQRSLDYFESHYDQRPIGELVLGPAVPERFTAALIEELSVTVATLDLNELFEFERPLDADEQAGCLLAVGAALRTNEVAA